MLFANRMMLLSFQPFALISNMVMTAVSQNYGAKRKEQNDKFVKMAVYVKFNQYRNKALLCSEMLLISLKHPKMQSRKIQATVRPFPYHRTSSHNTVLTCASLHSCNTQ